VILQLTTDHGQRTIGFPVPFSNIEVSLMLRRCGFPAVLLSLCLLSASACSKRGGSGTDVSGKVSYKGAPVTGGSIQFYPKQGGGSYPGTIKGDGTFAFKGIPFSGEVIVTIETESIKNSPAGMMKQEGVDPAAMQKMMDSMKGGASASAVYVPIPARYASPKTSPLNETLKQGSETQLDLVLKE
jgi:hypothetical protein